MIKVEGMELPYMSFIDMQKILSLADKFQWKDIPFEKLSTEDLKIKGPLGETLLHKLVLGDKLDLLSSGILSEDLLLQKTDKGETVYLYLARQKKLDRLPKELITKAGLLEPSLRGETPLERLVEFNMLDTIDPKFLYEDILLEGSRMFGATYLHFAAMTGALHKVPKELWADKLGLKDSRGANVLYWAGQGKLENFPATKENIRLATEPNNCGETALHQAQLCKLPPEYLTEESLSLQDNKGNTPLHTSAWTNSTTYLPIRYLNEKLLSIENHKKETPLCMILTRYQNQRDERNLINILKILSKETLSGVRGLHIKQEALELVVKELNTRKILEKIRKTEQDLEI